MKTVRALALLTAVLCGVASCGSPGARGAAKVPPASAPGTATPATDTTPRELDTTTESAPAAPSPAARPTGFEDTVWGMSREELTAVYPDFPRSSAYLYGLEATVELRLEDDALIGIAASFAKYFPDMESCGREFERVRAALGEELGRSQTDNLAAYWRTEHSSVVLECDPGDDDLSHARMSLRYAPIDE